MSRFTALVLTPHEPSSEDLSRATAGHADSCEPRPDRVLLLKNGTRSACAKAGDLDLDLNKEERFRLASEWADMTDTRREEGVFGPQYYLDRYGTAWRYTLAHAPNTFRALATSDGTWLEPGPVGPFGLCADTPAGWDAYLEAYRETVRANPDMWATAVTCHV